MADKKIKRPIGKKPDSRFVEVDFPFTPENYPAETEVVKKGKTFQITLHLELRASDKKFITRAIKKSRKKISNNMVRVILSKIEVDELIDES